MPERGRCKILPYVRRLMTLLRRRSISRNTLPLVDRGLAKTCVGGWRDLDFATLRQRSIRRERAGGVAGIQ